MRSSRETVDVTGTDRVLAQGISVEVVERPTLAWDELTAQFSDASYEQSVAYTACRWGEQRLIGVVLRDSQRRPVAAALAVTLKLPLVKAGFTHVKFGPLWRPKGIDASPSRLDQTLATLRRELGERRGLLVRVMPPAAPGFEADWVGALASTGFESNGVFPNPERYIVDLSLSEDDQLASFGKRWRNQLKRAATPELRFDELAGRAAVERFLPVFEAMLQRKRFDNRHGIEVLPGLLAHPVAAHRMRMFVAWHDGEPVALSAIGGAGDTLHVLFSATADNALPMRAGYALRWWTLGRLRDCGARWLDLGGDEGDEGLRHYKTGCVGKRGRIVSLPGEFDWCNRALSRVAAHAVAMARSRFVHRAADRLLRRV